ncbi:FAD binding domain-containing protein [Kutzneria chonburiensis]|uniref:FAD binding domain-containing protein n=1 Tax=Kutzneria chonburiensis TaxID=1483604 RepID=A0ABV6MT54_9PSEU|nr:FAD binding domain-containing protein [Kutzneria chonburiensis]
MHASSFCFHAPENVPAAVTALAQATDPAVLAGGQSLVPLLRTRRRQPDLVVDIGRIAELTGVRVGARGLVAGAAARQADVLAAADGLLAAALGSVGTMLTRRRGTIGGIVAHGDPGLQLAAVAAISDIDVTITGPGGPRTLAAAAFFTGQPLRHGELVTSITFAREPEDQGWGFARVAHRHTGPQLAGVAARVALDLDGRCRTARIAAYTLGHPGGELLDAAHVLVDARPDESTVDLAARAAASAVRPVSDATATADYRRHAVEVLTRRALHQALNTVRNGGTTTDGFIRRPLP